MEALEKRTGSNPYRGMIIAEGLFHQTCKDYKYTSSEPPERPNRGGIFGAIDILRWFIDTYPPPVQEFALPVRIWKA